ncbi:MAG: hypothetical protein HRO68_06390 [Nitrosopumilus sp.]|nr:hypothetical protein [Nitrosopumilus sp.]
MVQGSSKNREFYKNCAEYFEFLRKKGTTDYDFEDEYQELILKQIIL